MKKTIWLLLLGAFFLPVYADEVTLSWNPSTTRENGTPITGETKFEVFQNGLLVYEGSEPSYTTKIESGTAYWFELYQLEDGLRSKPIIKNILINRVPPARPNWSE